MLHQLLRFLCGKEHVKLLFCPSWSEIWLSLSNTSSKGAETATCPHVRLGPVEVRILCHEAELGIADLFAEPIRSISADILCIYLLNVRRQQPNIMSKGFCRLRPQTFL